MFIAQLSALDIGSYVTVTGVPKGNKYTDSQTGIITEVKHNTTSGHTTLRTEFKPHYHSKERQDKMVADVSGYARTWPFGAEVTIRESPL